MRALIAPLALLLAAADALAATVRLRSKANGNIIEAEVVEVGVEKLAFRLPGGDRVYTAEWDSLDTDWIRRNSPALWAERELLLKPADTTPDKPKEEASDPFAKEAPAASAKDILRNLASALDDRLRGPDSGRIESFCRETGTDEAAFWKAFDEMRRASGTLPPAKEGDKTPPSRSRDKERDRDSSRDKDRDKGESWRRDPALKAREESLRRESEKGGGTLTAAAYLRAIGDGGFQGRIPGSSSATCLATARPSSTVSRNTRSRPPSSPSVPSSLMPSATPSSCASRSPTSSPPSAASARRIPPRRSASAPTATASSIVSAREGRAGTGSQGHRGAGARQSCQPHR